jgi:DNA methyltransferase 1-associated protein 1
MGDIAQILGVSTSSSRNDIAFPTRGIPRAVKLQQLPKDVLALVGSGSNVESIHLPPAVPDVNISVSNKKGNNASIKNNDGDTVVKVGNKWISSSKPARQWKWAPFTSSARNDGLVLHHWVRNNVEYLDYPYARFNIHIDPVTYHGDSEYYALALNNDLNWSKSETDHLLELAQRYELRWPIIYDRWIEIFGYSTTSPNENRFKIEDLQYRYYTVAARIMQNRISSEAEAEAHTLALQAAAASAAMNQNNPTNNTSMPSGTTTSNNNTSSESQTNQQRTLDSLLIESAAAMALATTEPQYQPVIQNVGTGTSNKAVFDLNKERERRNQMEALWNRSKEEEIEEIELRKELKQIEAQLRKMKKSGAHIAAAARMNASPTATTTSQSPSRTSTPIQFSINDKGGVDLSTLPSSIDQVFSAAPIVVAGKPYLQSCRLLPPGIGDGSTINQALLSRMDTVLDELNIPQNPTPTKRVCDLYDTLRKDILTLLILQKEVLQKEGVLASKHLRLAKKSGNTHVSDEEALLGIVPPKPVAPLSRPPVTSTTTPGGKSSRATKTGKAVGTTTKKKANTTPKAGAVSDSAKSEISANTGKGATAAVGGKQPRKPSVPGAKRKRKSDDAAPKAATAGTAPTIQTLPTSTIVQQGTTISVANRPATSGNTMNIGNETVGVTIQTGTTSSNNGGTGTINESKPSAKKRAKKSNNI